MTSRRSKSEIKECVLQSKEELLRYRHRDQLESSVGLPLLAFMWVTYPVYDIMYMYIMYGHYANQGMHVTAFWHLIGQMFNNSLTNECP